MNFNNMTWIVINTDEVTDEMLSNIPQDYLKHIFSSEDKFITSVDDSKILLNWEGDTPSCFNGKTTYSYSQILEILEGDDWNNGLG